MTPKVLFLDLDGTLLNDAKEVTPENRQAMDDMLAAGHRIVITSGRPSSSALIQAHRLHLDGDGCYVVSFNGGSIYDCAQKKEIFHTALPLEDLYAVFDEANRRGIYIQTYDRDRVIIERKTSPENTKRYCNITQMEYRVVDDVRTDLTEPPAKALLIDFAGREKTEPMRQWILDTMQGRLHTFFSSSWYLEVVPSGVHKGRALMDMCRLLDIPVENTVAAGDEENDLTMIQTAAIGAAMRNAQPAVKAVADYVTQRDNNHDGVAEIIRKFIL